MRRVMLDRWSNWPWVDCVVGGVVALIVARWHPNVPQLEARTAVFSTLGTVLSLVGGLGNVAVSVHAGRSGPRLRALQRKARKPLRHNLGWAFIGSVVAALTAWSATILDGVGYHAAAWATTFGAAATALAIAARMAWLSLALIGLADSDDADEPTDNPAPPARVQTPT